MKKRIIAVIMAALTALAIQPAVWAAEDISPDAVVEEEALEAIQDVVADAAEVPVGAAAENAQDAADVRTDEIGGYYIVNYGQSDSSINLSLLFVSDLTAVSEQADTAIYDFREDGSVLIYDRGNLSQGIYTCNDTELTVTVDGAEHRYSYEFADGLLILRDDADSYVLYSFPLETGAQLEDYSVIEIDEAAVDITDEYVESFINSRLQGQTKTEVITEGVAQDGDYITISFSGVLEGETEPFEGGTGENYTVQLGTGALIDNYEEQLIGQPIGSTVDVTVTFPDDETVAENLRGKTATFATTIQSKTNWITPELTDEWVQEYTQEYLPVKLNTVQEFREYCRNTQYTNALHNAIFQVMAGKLQNVEYHNTEMARMLLSYAAANLTGVAQGYGLDAETFARQMGYNSADAYIQFEASSNIMSALIIDRILQDAGIHYTGSELDAHLAEDVKQAYGSAMSPEDYRMQSGPVGTWAYTNLQYKYNLATTALEDRVVLVPHQEAVPAVEQTETP